MGATYDSTKTYYQQAVPTAAAVAATSGQTAVTGSSTDFQNWQQANYNARQTSKAYVTRTFSGLEVGVGGWDRSYDVRQRGRWRS